MTEKTQSEKSIAAIRVAIYRLEEGFSAGTKNPRTGAIHALRMLYRMPIPEVCKNAIWNTISSIESGLMENDLDEVRVRCGYALEVLRPALTVTETAFPVKVRDADVA